MSLLVSLVGAVPQVNVDRLNDHLSTISRSGSPMAVHECVFDRMGSAGVASRKSSEARARRDLHGGDSWVLRILGHVIEPGKRRAVIRSATDVAVSDNFESLLAALDYTRAYQVVLRGMQYDIRPSISVRVFQLLKVVGPDGGTDQLEPVGDGTRWIVELAALTTALDGDLSAVEATLVQISVSLNQIACVQFPSTS
ncbi:Mediator of RNA polymerase II transcription subunit 18 [Plasmodiophora brassicae]|uniref:Mediator of RNA polymerase II transcription subunit 18 n=1 Tax=Plasmodiophora brassicae TaxID=37360 RepID=A0A0G4J3W9_PLABS|nr:hypothetical protein PBRA_008907 [Plasmodiophora brassicae]SPQ93748.1 unnamed protein product [Plasmodiophora brassicae]